jgi:hypothetical protein
MEPQVIIARRIARKSRADHYSDEGERAKANPRLLQVGCVPGKVLRSASS